MLTAPAQAASPQYTGGNTVCNQLAFTLPVSPGAGCRVTDAGAHVGSCTRTECILKPQKC